MKTGKPDAEALSTLFAAHREETEETMLPWTFVMRMLAGRCTCLLLMFQLIRRMICAQL